MTDWNEWQIAKSLAEGPFKSRNIVLLDNCNWTGYEADLFAVTINRKIIDVEIKISRPDLKADKSKEKWWMTRFHWHGYEGPQIRYGEKVCSHPPKVWKHYYAMPKEIWDDKLFEVLPTAESGVLLLSKNWRGDIVASVRRRAKPNRDAHVLTLEETLDVARLANIRMWKHRKGIEYESQKK
jgi:hypothetical protein